MLERIKIYYYKYFNDKYKKLFLKNTIALSILNVINYLFPLITTPYLIHTLNLVNFGKTQFIISLITYLNIVVDSGFTITGTKLISHYHFKKQKKLEAKYFWNVMQIKIIINILIFFILSIIGIFTHILKYDFKLFALAYLIIIGQTLAVEWYFKGISKLYNITIYSLFARILFCISIFVFVKSENDYGLAIGLQGFTMFLSGILTFIYAVYNIKYISYFFEINFKHLFKLYKSSIPNNLSQLITSFYLQNSVFIFGYFLSEHMLGIYSVIFKVINTITAILLFVANSAFSLVLSIKHDTKKVIKYTNYLIAFNICMFTFTFIILLIFRKFVFEDLFKVPNFEQNYSLELLLVALYLIPVSIDTIVFGTLVAINKEKTILKSVFYSLIFFAIILITVYLTRTNLLIFSSLFLTECVIMIFNLREFLRFKRLDSLQNL